VQQLSLRAAQTRVAELEQQVRAQTGAAGTAPDSAGFLGGVPSPRGPGFQAPAAPSGWSNPTAVSTAPRAPGFGDFLRSAATTAAGVAGGALLFQGLEGLFGPHHSGLDGGFLGGAGPEIVENTTVINAYGDPSSAGYGNDGDALPDPSLADDADFGDDGSLFDGGDDSGDWV